MPPADNRDGTSAVRKIIRSRAGCTRCRRLRKRCDQQKPDCSRCQVARSPCSYELNIKWGGRAFPKLLGGYAGRVQKLNNASEGDGFVYVADALPAQKVDPPRGGRDEYLCKTLEAPLAAAPGQPQGVLDMAAGNAVLPTFDDDQPPAAAVVLRQYQHPLTPPRSASLAGPPRSPALPEPAAAWMDLLRSQHASLSPLHLSAPEMSALSPTHRFLLHHYVHETIRLTVPSDYARTEICRSVVPMAFRHSCLLFAIMAFAARHLHSLGELPVGRPDLPGADGEAIVAGLERRSMASLRRQLTEPRFNQHVAALTTARLLCQTQIFSAGSAWRTHLEGARAILQAAVAPPSADAHEAAAAAASPAAAPPAATPPAAAVAAPTTRLLLDRKQAPASVTIHDFLASWYNNVEALAALTPLGLRWGQLQLDTNRLGNGGSRRDDVYFDVFGGVVSDVPDLFREVGALVTERRRRMRRRPGAGLPRAAPRQEPEASLLSDDDIACEAAALVDDIHARLERDTAGRLRLDDGLAFSLSRDDLHDYALSNASFLHTALLYIHGAVRCQPISAPEIRLSVAQIVRCWETMKSSSGLSPRVLMATPLFTAGLWAMPDARPAVRRSLQAMATWMRTPHIQRSTAVLEHIWSKTTTSGYHDVLTYLEETPEFLPY